MKHAESLDDIARSLRELLQSILREKIATKEDREHLAEILDCSPSLVKQMIYRGAGGMDQWVKALAYLYKIDATALANMRDQLFAKNSLRSADKIWFGIRENLGASEDEMFYLASCAGEAFRLKRELQPQTKSKRVAKKKKK